MTATATAAPAGRTGPLRHTVTRLAAANLTLLVWFWVCSVPVVVVASVLVDRLLGVDDASVVLYARHAAIWFPFSQAIALVALYLRLHVAAGMTRRTFARATVLVGVGTGAAYGVVLTVLAVVERGIHTALGRGWRVTDGFLADESSPLGLLLAELVVCCVVGNVSALLVGAAYQRWGGLRGLHRRRPPHAAAATAPVTAHRVTPRHPSPRTRHPPGPRHPAPTRRSPARPPPTRRSA